MIRSRILQVVAGASIGLAGILVCLPLGVYWWGLSYFDGLPEPPRESVAPAKLIAAWGEVERTKRIEVDRLTPWLIVPTVLSGRTEPHPGERAAIYVARSIVARELERGPMWRWHLTNYSLTIWLTRNWEPSELAQAVWTLEQERAAAIERSRAGARAAGDLKADERIPIQIIGPDVVCLSDQTIDFTVRNESSRTLWVSIGVESTVAPPGPANADDDGWYPFQEDVLQDKALTRAVKATKLEADASFEVSWVIGRRRGGTPFQGGEYRFVVGTTEDPRRGKSETFYLQGFRSRRCRVSAPLDSPGRTVRTSSRFNRDTIF